jgi:hypothetical protein
LEAKRKNNQFYQQEKVTENKTDRRKAKQKEV